MSYIDLYCERLAPGLLGEPINTLSNLAFFAAAAWLWHRAGAEPRWRGKGRWLAGLVALIGAGSFTFHAFATRWAELLDEVPILLFQLVFLGFYLRDVAAWRWSAVTAFLVGFVALGVKAGAYPGLVNGSLVYLPAWLSLLAIAARESAARRKGARALVAAGALFGVSVVFRSIDNAVCPDWPVGTHFLWHLCNALVLAWAAFGLLRSAGDRAR